MLPTDDRHDDAQLRGLLREWQVPDAPASLAQRVLEAQRVLGSRVKPARWWHFLLSGYIRVPVPVACALAVLLSVAMWRVSVRPPGPCVAEKIAAPENRAAQALPPDVCDQRASGVC